MSDVLPFPGFPNMIVIIFSFPRGRGFRIEAALRSEDLSSPRAGTWRRRQEKKSSAKVRIAFIVLNVSMNTLLPFSNAAL